LQLCDFGWEHPRNGPAVINAASNTTWCFTHARPNDPSKAVSLIELIKGKLRDFLSGWGRGSSVRIKTGTTVCGMRGTDFILSNDPDTGRVELYDYEGETFLFDTDSYEKRELSAGQKVVFYNGAFEEAAPLTSQEWNALVKGEGLNFGNTTMVYVSHDGVCDGYEPCFNTIQDAINAAAKVALIMVTEGTYLEDLVLDDDKNLRIQGGWDSTFSARTSDTTVSSAKISDGTLTSDSLTIQ